MSLWSPVPALAAPPRTLRFLTGQKRWSGRSIPIPPRRPWSRFLREHGVEVVLALPELGERAARLNFIFNQYVITGRPLIALKMATSSNGMVAEHEVIRAK